MDSRTKSIINITLLFTVLTFVGSCSDPVVHGIDYNYQMRLFIEEDPDGIELYSQNIYPDSTASFHLDSTDDLYFYDIDNVTRTYYYDIDKKPDTIFGFFDILSAVVTINDKFTGNVYRIRGNDTSRAYGLESNVQRFAYYLKLYGDAYQYAGWRFWAYSCNYYSPDGYFLTSDRDTIPAFETKTTGIRGFYNHLGSYVALKQDIVRLHYGDSITYFSRYKERIIAQNRDDDLQYFYNTVPDGDKYKIGWTVPESSDYYYHLITIDSDTTGYNFKEVKNNDDEVIDSVMVKTGDIVVPYSLGN